jgi:cell division protein FtsA
MIRNISVGIDIGTSTTRVVVGEFLKGEKNPRIIGVGESETNGLRHGYIVNSKETVASLKNALATAERTSGIKIKRAFVSISSTTLRSEIVNGSVVISKADGEITNLDIEKVADDCEKNLNLNLGNKKALHAFPLSFKLDGKEILGRPEGMKGIKLEAKTLFITCSFQHWEDLLEVMGEAGVEPIAVIASPIAGANIALSERQKIVGSGLVDIGSETVSLAVFENGKIISLQTFSIGSIDITNDIALGLKIPLEKAEAYKLDNSPTSDLPRKKLNEIIEARLSDIFELIENHLKKIKRNELLPAGIVFIGGGSKIARLEELSKSLLKLPSKIGTTDIFGNLKTKLREQSWFVVLGLIVSQKNNDYLKESSSNIFKEIKNLIKSSFKQLMP